VPPPSLLNFIAGLSAGAGINLLTSLQGSPACEIHTNRRIAAVALLWIVAAVFIAWAAHLAEHVEREAALTIERTFTREEKQLVRKDEASKVIWQFWILMGLAAVSVLVAVHFIPNLPI
jgi:hypothetical protein